MKKNVDVQLVRDSAWAWIIEIGGFVSSIVSFLVLGRLLGPSGYGRYVAIFAVTGPLAGLAYAGVSLSAIHHIVRQREDPTLVFASCLSIVSCSCSVASIASFFICRGVVHGASAVVLCLIIASELLLTPPFDLLCSTLQAGAGFAVGVRFRLLPMMLRVTGFTLLALVGEVTLLHVALMSVLIGSGALVVIGLQCVRRLQLKIRLGTPRMRYLRTSLWYSVSLASFSVQNDSDKAVLSANHLQRDAGIYAAAYRLTQLGQIPIRGIESATHQRFLSRGADNQRLVPFTRVLALVSAVYSVVFGVSLFFAAPLVADVLGSGFAGSTTIIRWLSPFILVRTQSGFPLNALLGLGRTAVRATLQTAAAVLSLALYIALVPSMSWKGAVVGTIIGETALSISAWICLSLFDHAVTSDQHDRLDAIVG